MADIIECIIDWFKDFVIFLLIGGSTITLLLYVYFQLENEIKECNKAGYKVNPDEPLIAGSILSLKDEKDRVKYYYKSQIKLKGVLQVFIFAFIFFIIVSIVLLFNSIFKWF